MSKLHCALVLQLIQCKADTNAANEHGNTPLHYACFWGQDLVAEVSAPPGGQSPPLTAPD